MSTKLFVLIGWCFNKSWNFQFWIISAKSLPKSTIYLPHLFDNPCFSYYFNIIHYSTSSILSNHTHVPPWFWLTQKTCVHGHEHTHVPFFISIILSLITSPFPIPRSPSLSVISSFYSTYLNFLVNIMWQDYTQQISNSLTLPNIAVKGLKIKCNNKT